MHPKDSLDNNLRWPAAVTALFLVGILTGLLVHTFHGQKLNDLQPVRTPDITNSIFTTYIIPFEVVGVLLLGALIGAVLLARKD
jgi:NADH-quinone oxidoreductase subunit J